MASKKITLTLPQAMERAVDAYQRQGWAEAERLCQSVLGTRPDHADALNLMGAIAVQTRRLARAAEFFRRAVAANPNSADSRFNLGVVLTDLGRPEDALASYDRAVELAPDRTDAHFNRGLLQAGLGRFEDALASFDRTLALMPDLAEGHNNRGNVLAELGRPDEALAGYDRAIELNPDYAEAYNNLANVLNKVGRLDEALAGYDRAIDLDPNDAEIYNNRTDTLAALGRFDEALASCDRAIELRPDYAQAYNNRGIVLNRVNRLDEAQASYDRAVELDPGEAEFFSNRGNNLTALGRMDDARASYDRAIVLDPDYAPAHRNLALLTLLTGDFRGGWKEYEWRWKLTPDEGFPEPRWTGKEPLDGRTILLRSEQGYGDTIQFCRYAKDVAALGAHVVLDAPARLRWLLKSLEGVSQTIEKGSAPPEFDYECPLMSLPLAFGTQLGSIPAAVPYLRSDPSCVAAWRDVLGEKTRPRVGLAWRGSPSQVNDHNRSIALSEILPLLVDKVEWVSLHKEVPDADGGLLDSRNDIRHFGDRQEDFSDAAAIIELSDLVISVDTSLAHLAGAMGKPVWILLPFVPDWRWMLDRDDSPWYPTARLFRQPTPGDWTSVIDAVRVNLLRRIAG